LPVVADLFDGYQRGVAWDEVFASSGRPHEAAQDLHDAFSQLSAEDLAGHSVALARAFRDQGITFSLFGEERPFPLDLVPRIIPAEEWRGVVQRVRALEALPGDLSEAQEVLHEGKKGHRYLTVVVDHDRRRLIWAAPGKDRATLHRFLDLLGEQRCAQLNHVSAALADWIAAVVAQRCPNAVRYADAFHVVAWATEALDEVRRQAWNTARGAVHQHRAGRATGTAKALKHARYALWKNPENLTDKQAEKLAWIAKTDPRLHPAYLLKEGPRHVFTVKGEAGKEALDRWVSCARRCRISAFVELARKIVKHRAAIDAALEHELSNALVESTNTKIRLLTRVAFGFRSPDALIALAMLSLGGHRPGLPGRAVTS
jgi:transposase